MNWTVELAIAQIRSGNPYSQETESATDWLYTTLYSPQLARTAGEMILDALIDEVKDRE